MRCLLLALSVALACGTQDIFVPQTGEDLDVQKVAGTWYPIAVVASDITLLSTETAPMRLFVKELRPTAQDGLEITVRRWEDGSCVERKMFTEKTEMPTSFQINKMEGGNVVPNPDLEDVNVVPNPDLEDGNMGQIPDLEEARVHLLDTDYKNYVFLCVEAPATERSLACQYLARTPKIEEAVMEQFNRAMKLFSMRVSATLTPAQATDPCHV